MLGMAVFMDTFTNTFNLAMDSMNLILKNKTIKLQRKYTEMLQRGLVPLISFLTCRVPQAELAPHHFQSQKNFSWKLSSV